MTDRSNTSTSHEHTRLPHILSIFSFYYDSMHRSPLHSMMVFFFSPRSVYIFLITLEAASIGIKYQGLSTNPFQEPRPSMLLFLIAIFCHAISLAAKIGWPTTIIFHVSGILACETLLWILVAEFWWWCAIINVIPLLVAVLCFYYKSICELLSNLLNTYVRWILAVETSNIIADHLADLEAEEG